MNRYSVYNFKKPWNIFEARIGRRIKCTEKFVEQLHDETPNVEKEVFRDHRGIIKDDCGSSWRIEWEGNMSWIGPHINKSMVEVVYE
jgi:hypothetical protein